MLVLEVFLQESYSLNFSSIVNCCAQNIQTNVTRVKFYFLIFSLNISNFSMAIFWHWPSHINYITQYKLGFGKCWWYYKAVYFHKGLRRGCRQRRVLKVCMETHIKARIRIGNDKNGCNKKTLKVNKSVFILTTIYKISYAITLWQSLNSTHWGPLVITYKKSIIYYRCSKSML